MILWFQVRILVGHQSIYVPHGERTPGWSVAMCVLERGVQVAQGVSRQRQCAYGGMAAQRRCIQALNLHPH